MQDSKRRGGKGAAYQPVGVRCEVGASPPPPPVRSTRDGATPNAPCSNDISTSRQDVNAQFDSQCTTSDPSPRLVRDSAIGHGTGAGTGSTTGEKASTQKPTLRTTST